MLKRIGMFVYGVVSYFIFLGTFLGAGSRMHLPDQPFRSLHRRRVPMLVPSGGHASGWGVASYAQNPSDLPFGPPYGEEP